MKKFLDKMRHKKDDDRVLKGLTATGKKVLDDYEFGEVLGKGTFSTVRLGKHRVTGQHVAIKIIEKENVSLKATALRTEVQVLQHCKHPAIVNMLDVYEDDAQIHMIMDLMIGGELFERICDYYPTGYSEKVSSKIIHRVLDAVAYLHDQGIIHRDLKPENLLYATEGNDEDIRISDFGLAKVWKAEIVAKTACGSPNYVAPEVLVNHASGYTAAVDMWSIGVILYVLLCGFCPFYDEKLPQLFKFIISGTYNFPSPYWDNISDSAKDLIRHLLCVDPSQRYTARQALEHPWVKSNNLDRPITNIDKQWKSFEAQRGGRPDTDPSKASSPPSSNASSVSHITPSSTSSASTAGSRGQKRA